MSKENVGILGVDGLFVTTTPIPAPTTGIDPGIDPRPEVVERWHSPPARRPLPPESMQSRSGPVNFDDCGD